MPGSFANQIQAACRSHNPELIAGLSYNLMPTCLPCFVWQMPMLWRCCCPTRQSPLCGTTTALGDSTGSSPRVVLRPKSSCVRAFLTKVLKSLKGKEGGAERLWPRRSAKVGCANSWPHCCAAQGGRLVCKSTGTLCTCLEVPAKDWGASQSQRTACSSHCLATEWGGTTTEQS